ncbi:MAG: ribonuclease III family protein [Candidatus Hodarchaeota archaeon]
MIDSEQDYEEFHRLCKIPHKIPLDLLFEALTHPSYKNVDNESLDFERLETVGDAVLDLIVVTWLYENGAENPLQLTNARSLVVENKMLTHLGKELKINDFLRTAPSYEIQSTDLADAVEALIGAFFLAHGFEKSFIWLVTILKSPLKDALEEIRHIPLKWGFSEQNPVNLLQEFFQKRHLSVPIPKLVKIEGKDHKKTFTIEYEVIYKGLKYISQGTGRKKKTAKKAAAEDLCIQLGILA